MAKMCGFVIRSCNGDHAVTSNCDFGGRLRNLVAGEGGSEGLDSLFG